MLPGNALPRSIQIQRESLRRETHLVGDSKESTSLTQPPWSSKEPRNSNSFSQYFYLSILFWFTWRAVVLCTSNTLCVIKPRSSNSFSQYFYLSILFWFTWRAVDNKRFYAQVTLSVLYNPHRCQLVPKFLVVGEQKSQGWQACQSVSAHNQHTFSLCRKPWSHCTYWRPAISLLPLFPKNPGATALLVLDSAVSARFAGI